MVSRREDSMLMSEAVRELQRLIEEVGDLPLCLDYHDESIHVKEFCHYEEIISCRIEHWTLPAYVEIYGGQPLERIILEKRKDEFADVKKIPCRLSDLEEK